MATRQGVTTEPAQRLRETWEAGFATRRDWPDGSHDVVGFRWSATSAARFRERDRRYWRRGPVRPTTWAVVVISRRDFDLHSGRRECRSPDCSGERRSR
ncbi:MAG: hypothetical protein QOI74_3429 [Micromonosporaceae bacterium]|jgi:hypothetical protein|nr:hypothetical protein [Micromonosporaceae bacterium]MDT5038297.1 hypothetical protein [Micromonosporaceae bacterium]